MFSASFKRETLWHIIHRSRGKQLVLFSLMFPETKCNGSKNTQKKPLERGWVGGGGVASIPPPCTSVNELEELVTNTLFS